MRLDRTKKQRFKVSKDLEKRRNLYYNQTREFVGFMCYVRQKRGGAERWKER